MSSYLVTASETWALSLGPVLAVFQYWSEGSVLHNQTTPKPHGWRHTSKGARLFQTTIKTVDQGLFDLANHVSIFFYMSGPVIQEKQDYLSWKCHAWQRRESETNCRFWHVQHESVVCPALVATQEFSRGKQVARDNGAEDVFPDPSVSKFDIFCGDRNAIINKVPQTCCGCGLRESQLPSTDILWS
jgi:hypothetical protein